jgi:hypothetical protein
VHVQAGILNDQTDFTQGSRKASKDRSLAINFAVFYIRLMERFTG